MGFDASERISNMEGIRDEILTTLRTRGIDKLGEKELALLEKTLTNGVKVAVSMQDIELRSKSVQSENAYRENAAAFIRGRREEGNRLAQAVREGTVPSALAEAVIPVRALLPGEDLMGQFQVGFDVLSGQKPFVPSENLPPPPRDDEPPVGQ